jgi:predicted lipid-binding transport protein (Tim44 family)
MMSSKRIRASFKAFAVVMALALPAAIAISSVADARANRGGSSGSRGSNTFSAPPATKTAPTAAQPMQRTQAQPTAPATAPQTTGAGGMFSRPGMGMLGGLAAGFLGAGLLGMLFGGSLFGGLGGIASFFGLLLQVGLIALVAMLALRWWRSRNAPSYASGPANFDAGRVPQPPQQPSGGGFGGGFGGMGAGATAAAAPVAKGPIKITPDDYDAFERLLADVQAAWSNEDKAALARLTTPEMESYFTADLADNAAKGVVNKVDNVKLLQGDLAEAWHEGSDDYATVALRFGLTDKTIERATGRVVEGSDQPVEATELWTFVRPNNGTWMLSAIQQTN